MVRRHHKPGPSDRLIADIEEALARVEVARGRLDQARSARSELGVRRRAHAELRGAYLDADTLLREATRAAKEHSYWEWTHWRRLLSQLDTARQQHLFEEADESGIRPSGSVRAIDTGMSGPAIGELQHGECSPAGKAATYGLDVEAVLLGRDQPSPEASRAPAEVVPLTSPGGAGVQAGAEVA